MQLVERRTVKWFQKIDGSIGKSANRRKSRAKRRNARERPFQLALDERQVSACWYRSHPRRTRERNLNRQLGRERLERITYCLNLRPHRFGNLGNDKRTIFGHKKSLIKNLAAANCLAGPL